MLGDAPNLLRRIFGARSVVVDRVSRDLLSLHYGRMRTVFDRVSGQIRQGGKLAGALGSVERIELHRPVNQEGTVNWFITVRLLGGRTVEVGQVTEEIDASAIAARIATITSRPVVVGR
jgi:hypothetical protein